MQLGKRENSLQQIVAKFIGLSPDKNSVAVAHSSALALAIDKNNVVYYITPQKQLWKATPKDRGYDTTCIVSDAFKDSKNLFVDNDGNIWVSDTEKGINKYTPGGKLLGSPFAGLTGTVAFGASAPRYEYVLAKDQLFRRNLYPFIK